MKIKIRIDREGLEPDIIKGEIYAQDIGGMIYIIFGTNPMASIIKLTESYKKGNGEDIGWRITSNIGNWGSMGNPVFEDREQAIEKVIRYMLRHPIEMVQHIDHHYRSITHSAYVKVTIMGDYINIVNVSSQQGNVYLPYRVSKVNKFQLKKYYQITDEFSGKRIHSEEGNIQYRTKLEYDKRHG